MRRWSSVVVILFASCFAQLPACPSPPGGTCDPRSADCPKGYSCAIAEVCTCTCEQTSDCWTLVTDGCRSNNLPGQRLPDGGVFTETSNDGFCPESQLMECIDGYCQRFECEDGGCDYDLYGPSAFKSNRDQGPQQ